MEIKFNYFGLLSTKFLKYWVLGVFFFFFFFSYKVYTKLIIVELLYMEILSYMDQS